MAAEGGGNARFGRSFAFFSYPDEQLRTLPGQPEFVRAMEYAAPFARQSRIEDGLLVMRIDRDDETWFAVLG